jgi:large subunit ribosomal protein L24e
MVIKRQCSFCADEIEPGTGLMFVKRDGTVFHFCSSSCRKQQVHLHRVGHRLKWTHAHALRRAAEQAQAVAPAAGGAPTPSSRRARAPAKKPPSAGARPSPKREARAAEPKPTRPGEKPSAKQRTEAPSKVETKPEASKRPAEKPTPQKKTAAPRKKADASKE